MPSVKDIARALIDHVGEVYTTLDKGSTGKNIRHDAAALASNLKTALPMLAKDPQYVTMDDMLNSGVGVMPLSTLKGALSKYKAGKINNEYKGSHVAPMSGDSTAPLYELNKIYPEDIYSNNAANYYGHGENPFQDRQLMDLFKNYRNKPDEMVTAYRAVPKDAPKEINHGDWVTLDKKYAQEHGKSYLEKGFKVDSIKVPAKTLFTNGDSPYEFGLDLSVLDKKGLPVMGSIIKKRAD